jgi:hypothetical protein
MEKYKTIHQSQSEINIGNVVTDNSKVNEFLLKQNSELLQSNKELLGALEEIMRFKNELKYVMSEKLASPENFLKAIDNLEQLIQKHKL